MNLLAMILALAFTDGSAPAEQMPNEVDLKAAYCGRVLRLQSDSAKELEALLPAEQVEARAHITSQMQERNERQARILAYLTPRIKYLDPEALLAAVKIADADSASNAKLIAAASCDKAQVEQISICVNTALQASPARRKQRQCDTLDWLPF